MSVDVALMVAFAIVVVWLTLAVVVTFAQPNLAARFAEALRRRRRA